MWSRRRFLETVSTLPLVGGTVAAAPRLAEAARNGNSDYFRELGVRPFINAAGTYTAMTASLMPPEVMDAIQYASKHYVMLDELHDKVGQRLASLLHCEAAMVTSGAASALTLGTAAVLTGKDQKKIVDLPNLAGMKTSYEYVAVGRPDVWKHKPEEFADLSFVEELDKSGFIKKLYEK